MNEFRIAIVNSSSFGQVFPKHIERLEKLGEVAHFTFDSEIGGKELAQELQGYNLIVASVTPFFTEEFFEHKDELRLITRHGIGYNNIDLVAAKKHNTLVSIVPALVERDAVAENNITNLLSVMRMTVQSQDRVKADRWEDRAEFVGHTLYGKTVGVIGVGNTGSGVAETLRQGFRCQVLGCDPNKSAMELAQFGAKKVELDELLEKADVICLCASLTDSSLHMIDKEQVAKMKDHVYLSNSARGALVVEEAIVEGLASGKIAGFATDVLEVEPGRKDHPYLAFDNALVTPHTSAYTMECLEEMGNKCVTDCERIAEGLLPGRAVQAESIFVTA
ncbi:D-isomer specific 2-hydroxyacid dehydrogenase family protein [Enterococcus asini]|uniref:D-isomer specific 2-hydroxyacid dehydrogenase family protein n=1 Tax=Enterococcus asini TaxID=57732 RepID=UPI00288F81C8|nr:D-isomer specific 2-hydroxyacid dehydrogenase family protein [Enterococcus asini]MDT2757373.1 D-isomer specific 2-hydroxyacid dehydrogenase family protein [Enterococcus asini]